MGCSTLYSTWLGGIYFYRASIELTKLVVKVFWGVVWCFETFVGFYDMI